MKTKQIDKLDDFSGTVLIPVLKPKKSIVPIQFEGLEILSKVFYGKKDTSYLAEKTTLPTFIGLGKSNRYKALKTIARRIAAKKKRSF
jgi:leucyl aminopeptidase